jgi:hypothetical protein
MRVFLAGACLVAAAALAGAASDQPQAKGEPKGFNLEQFIKEHDKNKDGFLDRSEWPERLKDVFDRIDGNKDGKLSREELNPVQDRLARQFGPADGKGGARSGEVNTPPAKGERHEDKLKEGDPAPDFSLPLADGKKEIKLSSFQGKKPVVLIFGSYT